RPARCRPPPASYLVGNPCCCKGGRGRVKAARAITPFARLLCLTGACARGYIPPPSRPRRAAEGYAHLVGGTCVMGRNILAVVLGVALAGSLVFAVEALGHRIYPPPEGLKADDYEAIKAYVAQAPVGALLFVPLSWFVGTLAGCWLTGCVARPQESW